MHCDKRTTFVCFQSFKTCWDWILDPSCESRSLLHGCLRSSPFVPSHIHTPCLNFLCSSSVAPSWHCTSIKLLKSLLHYSGTELRPHNLAPRPCRVCTQALGRLVSIFLFRLHHISSLYLCWARSSWSALLMVLFRYLRFLIRFWFFS